MANIQDKVQFLKENGVEDWEIEAITAHGSLQFRNQVSQALELSPTERPLDEGQALDLAEYAAVAQRGPVEPRDVALAQDGKMPEALATVAAKYREKLQFTPAAMVLEPDNVDVIKKQLTTDNEALRAGMKEEMRTFPSEGGDADILALEAAHMEQRQIREQAKIDEDRRERLLTTNFVPGNRPATIFGYDINGDWQPQLAAEFLPRTAKDFWDWTNAWIEAGLLPDDIWTRVMGTVGARGSTGEEVLATLDAMSPEEQDAAMKKFLDVYTKSLPTALRSDFNVYWAVTDTYHDEYIKTGEVENKFNKWALNITGWLGAVEAMGAAGFLVTRPIKAGLRMLMKSRSITRLGQMQNPTWYARSLREAFHSMPDAAVNKYFNTNKIDIAQSQLPAPATGEQIVNIPDGIVEPRELERITEATEAAMDSARRLHANVYTSEEQGLIINNVIEEIEAANTGRLRLGMSEVELKDDLSGVNLNMMIGADEKTGFKSLDEAVDYAANELGVTNLEYFRVKPNGELEKVKPTLTKKEGQVINKTPMDGEFLIRAKYEHVFSAADSRLFDGTPVIAGGWMGRFLGVFNTPSTFLDTKAVGKFTRSYLREQALVNQLDSIIAPLYKQTTAPQRRAINDMMVWAEKFGENEGRMPTLDEVRLKFPNAGSTELSGFYTARHFQDTLYSIQNARLHNNWKARGFVSVSKSDVNLQYHGAPLERGAVKGSSFLDPETGKSRTLSGEELDEFYERGGSVIRMELSMQGSPGQAHRLVLVDPDSGWAKRPLRRHVLEYRPGYNTRMYQDAHFVQRVKNNARIDGKAERHVSTMRTATTAKEAEIFQRRVIDALGRKLYKDGWNKKAPLSVKRELLADKGYDIVVSRDARLSDADRVKVDLEKMQVEGRLFFDNRQKIPLRNTDNKPAELVDPIDSMQRTARMAARQVSTELLVDAQKTQFFKRHKDLGLNSRKTSAEIDADLTSIIKQGSKEERESASRARGWWRYIRFMEGSMNTSPSAFRGMTIKAAEWVDYSIGSKLGARSLTKGLSRGAGNVNPVNAAKQLAFLHFITARPLRQLILQGAQHFNLQAIDPLYIGRWQMDTWSLLSAMKRLTTTREDQFVWSLKRKQMGGMMGYSDEEMEILLREFSQSGLVDGVDVHSYAGGMPKSSITTPTSRIGQGVQETLTAVQTPIHMARSLGFDLGEQFNVTASYLMALRRHTKEKGIKKLTDLGSNDWDEIANRGSQYALAMHKANAASWQYGLISLPMQFLQFTHKWLLTTLGASKTMRKLGLANQQFTQSEAIKMMMGQVLMWGGAGYALKEPVRNAINNSPTLSALLNEDQKDILASGVADWGINEVLRNILEDEDLDFAFDDVFAPSMGIAQLAEKVVELGTEPTMIYEPLLGPAGEVYTRYSKAWAVGQALVGKDFEHWSPAARAEGVIEAAAAGLFAGYSDILKVRLAMKMGQWTNTAGVPLGLEAKWEEIVMKGALGINPDKLLDYYRVSGKSGDLLRDVKDNAKAHAEVVNKIVLQWSDNKLGEADALAQLNTVASVYELHKEDGLGELYYEAFMAEFQRLRDPDGERLTKRINDMLMMGYTGDPVADFINSEAVPRNIEPQLRSWFNRMTATEQENVARRERLFEAEKEEIRRTTDGK